MTFMDSLNSSPGNSSIANQPGPDQGPDVLNLVRQIKGMNMNDYKEKANFMSDLSLKQDRLKTLYSLSAEAVAARQGGQEGSNTVMSQDPNQMTGYQKGELGIRQQEANTESQKLAQTGKLGQESMNIKSSQEKLNQEKSDQINANKQADMERKINEANQKIELAQKALTDKTANQEAQLKSHQDLAAAVEERHKLEIARMQHQFDITSDQHQQTIDDMKKRLDQAGNTKQTTEMNADGTKKTVTTSKGAAAKTINVKGKDGKMYPIPADKLDDWNANHAPDDSGDNDAYKLNPGD